LITYRLELAPTTLTTEQSIPCGLILNELITNALKYPYPAGTGEINVRLLSKENSVWMTVSDCGVGVPANFDWKASKSLGTRIVEVLTSQLDGDLEIGLFRVRPLRSVLSNDRSEDHAVFSENDTWNACAAKRQALLAQAGNIVSMNVG
jgi:signal transduction histidine kinase